MIYIVGCFFVVVVYLEIGLKMREKNVYTWHLFYSLQFPICIFHIGTMSQSL